MRTAISPRLAIRILENKRLPAAVLAIMFGGLDDRSPALTTLTSRQARAREPRSRRHDRHHPDQDHLVRRVRPHPAVAENSSRALEAALTPEERDVLLHHGTEAPFCGGLLGQQGGRRLLLPALRPAALPAQDQVRERHRLAELLRAVRRGPRARSARHQLRHGPHRDPLRALRQPPGPRLPRRPARRPACATASTRSRCSS